MHVLKSGNDKSARPPEQFSHTKTHTRFNLIFYWFLALEPIRISYIFIFLAIKLLIPADPPFSVYQPKRKQLIQIWHTNDIEWPKYFVVFIYWMRPVNYRSTFSTHFFLNRSMQICRSVRSQSTTVDIIDSVMLFATFVHKWPTNGRFQWCGPHMWCVQGYSARSRFVLIRPDYGELGNFDS